MTPDAILSSVVAVVAAVIASAVVVWIMRRGEERAALGTAVRHDEQIRALGQALTDLRQEVARQGHEMREMMARITARLDAMDARLTRLETRLDERDRHVTENRKALVKDAVGEMRDWCETRCDVRREQEGYSGVHPADPRMPRHDPGAEKP